MRLRSSGIPPPSKSEKKTNLRRTPQPRTPTPAVWRVGSNISLHFRHKGRTQHAAFSRFEKFDAYFTRVLLLTSS